MVARETNARNGLRPLAAMPLVVAWTDDTGDHLETLKEVNEQMQEISVQRQTLHAKYFEKLDGFADKDLRSEYFDEIHHESFGNDLKSEYCDIIRDASFGNKDSKLGPTLNPKQVREKNKKPRCKDNCTETQKSVQVPLRRKSERKRRRQGARTSTLKRYITRVLATRALGTRTTNVDRLSLRRKFDKKGRVTKLYDLKLDWRS